MVESSLLGNGLKKYAYMGLAPWLFARRDEPDVCKLIILQAQSRPLEEHHRTVQELMQPDGQLCADLAARASSGEMTRE